MNHDLKTKSAHFDAIAAGTKTFDMRRNDRGFQAGDLIRFYRNDAYNDCRPDCAAGCRPDQVTRLVTFVFSGDPSLRDCGGVVPGYVVLGLSSVGGSL